jgi:hypothetical protein
MKKPFLLLLALSLVCSCSKSPPPKTNSDDTKPNATFWQLEDDSNLEVEVRPWPPSAGKADIIAETSVGDWGGSVPAVESVQVRVVSDQNSTATYQSMTRVEKVEGSGEDAVTHHIYTAKDVKLSSGKQFVQFRVKGKNFQREAALGDWSLNIP